MLFKILVLLVGSLNALDWGQFPQGPLKGSTALEKDLFVNGELKSEYQLKRQVADVRGGRISYFQLGQINSDLTKPVVLFFHGSSVGVAGTVFREAQPYRYLKYPIVFVERPGYGQTRAVKSPRRCSKLVEGLVEALRLAEGKSLIVAANSGGGPCAIQFAQRYEKSDLAQVHPIKAVIFQAAVTHTYNSRAYLPKALKGEWGRNKVHRSSLRKVTRRNSLSLEKYFEVLQVEGERITGDPADELGFRFKRPIFRKKFMEFYCRGQWCYYDCITKTCRATGMLMEAARLNESMVSSEEKYRDSIIADARKDRLTAEEKQLLVPMSKLMRESSLQSEHRKGKRIDGQIIVGFSKGIGAEAHLIKYPTLILHDKLDQIVPFSHAEYLNEKIKNSDLVCAKAAGHTLVLGPDAVKLQNLRMSFMACHGENNQRACLVYGSLKKKLAGCQ